MANIITLTCKGWRLVLDPGEFYEGGTPAMIYAPFGRGSATYDCGVTEGAVMGANGDCEIPPAVQSWLNNQEDFVLQWYKMHGV